MSKNAILSLIERFETHKAEYTSGVYNETQLRRDFLDPFFEALGWDIFNQKGWSEAFREVIHEDALQVEGSNRAPDYCFRLGGRRVFFVEAKKPSVSIRDDVHPAYQLRRYAWSAKLPVSILTDFQEFAVYDCRIKPTPTDKASTARVMYLTFDQFPAQWEALGALFSPEAIQKGALEKYVGSAKLKRGTALVDDAFLEEIEGWREILAKSIALRNPNLSTRDLNFTVQRTIDRVIFLRICEDRGIETYATLRDFQNGANIYERLVQYFRQADDRYNSGLFHFRDEKDQSEAPDILTPRIKIDDKPLKDILKSLYYPECPYEFSVLGADILGSVYERFLGKVIRLTAGHRAVVEDKPEVRKAGGVFYTPTYIVDYIVKNTVGKLLEGKTPKQVSELRFLDLACGSGSFLIGAFQYLLDWHLEQYVKDPEKWAKGKDPALYQSHERAWKLTTQERKRILLNNIYGVDIDSQAVEVTKLSLLLKVLEGESGETISKQLKLFHERALPDLGSNIKCGNSLIASNFSLVPEDIVGVNAFDWPVQFPTIFKAGGFDAIIGNPPWGAQLGESELEYLRMHHRSIIVRMIDSFMYFAHNGVERLRVGGMFGMILPDVMLYQTDTEKLRHYFTEKTSLTQICNMGNVFDQVTRPACIVVCLKEIRPTQKVLVADFSLLPKEEKPKQIMEISNYAAIKQSRISRLPGYLFTTSGFANYPLWDRVSTAPSQPLADLVDEDGIQRGVSPDLKEAFLVTRKTAKEWKLEAEKLRPVLTGGKHVKRYDIARPDMLLIYTERDTDYRRLPRICAYIDQFNKQITCKEVQQKKHSIYSLHRARLERIFLKPQKLVGVITEDEIVLALDDKRTFATDGLYVFGLKPTADFRYVMGVLNSRLFVSIYRLLTMEEGRALAQVKPTVLAKLPIRTIDFSKPADRKIHDALVELVDKMLMLLPRLRSARTDAERAAFQNAATATGRQIDKLVYSLYSLSEKEIKIIEGTGNE